MDPTLNPGLVGVAPESESHFYLRRSHAGQWMIFGLLLLSVKIELMGPFRRPRDMGSWVIEVTEFDFEVRCDLRGCLEATMASEVTKMAVRGNMHNDTRVIEVADFKSKVKFEF